MKEFNKLDCSLFEMTSLESLTDKLEIKNGFELLGICQNLC